jgi:hypothetical protein
MEILIQFLVQLADAFSGPVNVFFASATDWSMLLPAGEAVTLAAAALLRGRST